jgi:NAD(P)-dependent dehydrogenase (short-subunit alcohol dehydrogenase family)
MAFGLEGKVAVVTGAASGIGEASARRLIEAGAKVCLVDLNNEGLQRLVTEFGSDRAVAAAADVASVDGARQYVAAALNAFGRLDLLHSNAGIVGEVGPIQSSTAANFDHVFAVNVRSSVLAIGAVVPEILKQGGGAIVITASCSGIRPSQAGLGVYGASKIALVGLMRTAAMELGPQGIRVNAIAPGLTDTPAFRATSRLGARNDDSSIFDKLVLPLKRIGSPREVANLSTWLLGDEASYVTGGLYHVDGGLGA